MSILTTVAKPSERIAKEPKLLHEFSVAKYHKMIQTGILTPNDRVELLEGWIVNKMSQNPPHRSSLSRIIRWLGKSLPTNWTLSCQGPITLSDSEPEPDITVARGADSSYDGRHPRPADLGIVMEVGDSSLLNDRRYKGTLYARAAIAEFWLVNVPERKIEVYTSPLNGEYQTKIEYTEQQSVPLVLDGVKIADLPVNELIAKP